VLAACVRLPRQGVYAVALLSIFTSSAGGLLFVKYWLSFAEMTAAFLLGLGWV
jgi:hypothetical protein